MDMMQGQQRCVVEQECEARPQADDHYSKYWWLYESIKVGVAVAVMIGISGGALLALFWLTNIIL